MLTENYRDKKLLVLDQQPLENVFLFSDF